MIDMKGIPPQPVKTPLEKKLVNLDKRDKLFRGYTVFVLSLVVLFVVISMLSLRTMAKDNNRNITEHNGQIQGILKEGKERERRQAENDERVHEELKRYIECIVLIRFALTPEQIQDQEAVKTALRECAVVSKLVLNESESTSYTPTRRSTQANTLPPSTSTGTTQGTTQPAPTASPERTSPRQNPPASKPPENIIDRLRQIPNTCSI